MEFKYDREKAKAIKHLLIEERLNNTTGRIVGSALNKFKDFAETPANIIKAADNAARGNNQNAKKWESERIPIAEAKTFGEKAANFTGNMLGEIGVGALIGATTGGLGLGAKAGSAVTSGLASKGVSTGLSKAAGGAAGSFIDNMAADLIQDTSRGIAEKKSAGDIAKDIGESALWNTAVGGVLGGVPELVKASKAKKALKAEEATKKAADLAAKAGEADAFSKQLSDKVASTIGKNADGALPINSIPKAQPIEVGKPASNIPDGMDIGTAKAAETGAETAGYSPLKTFDDTDEFIATKAPALSKGVDEIAAEIGDKKAFNNLFNAMSEDMPTGEIDINGTKMPVSDYVDKVEKALPDTVEELKQSIDHLETVKAAEIGKGEKRNLLTINLQLFGAKRKLEWLELAEGENGSIIRGFVKKRQLGDDEIKSPEFINALNGKADKYIPQKDIVINEKAARKMDIEEGRKELYNRIMQHEIGDTTDALSPEDIAAGKMLLNRFLNEGDYEKAIDLTNGIGRYATEDARRLRQYAMQKTLEPDNILKFASKKIELDAETAKKLTELTNRAKGFPEFSVERAEAMNEIFSFIGSKMPYTKGDILNSWRYLAMLANPKTHLRNTLSNAVNMPMRKTDDAIASLLEKALPETERTRALGWKATEQGKALLPSIEAATKKAEVEMLNYGKFDISDSAVLRERPAFGNSKLGKVMNKGADKNAKWLNAEDKGFFTPAFKDNLGQFMTSRGLTEVTDEAYEFAKERALQATFRANNAINDFIKSIRNYKNVNHPKFATAVRGISSFIIPFSKTPANLLEQAFKYSPINLGVSGKEFIKLIKTGKSNRAAADIVHDFARGINGTALFALGCYLGGSGIINTKYGTGEKQRAAEELEGQQQYSVKIGDKTISFDWLQPVAFPLIAGASIGQALGQQSMDDDDQPKTWTDHASNLFSTITAGADSVFQLSMLQSLSDLNMGDTEHTLSSLVSNATSQFIPTAVGQFSRAIDPIQRKTKGDNPIDTIWNRVIAKTPLSSTLQPELDVFGDEVRRGNTDSWMLNAFNQVLNPASVKGQLKKDDPYTQMMLDIYKSSRKSAALPSAPTKDGDNPMTVQQYTDTAKQVGAEQYRALQTLASNPNKTFKVQVMGANGKAHYVNKRLADMTDKEKALVLGRVFNSAKDSEIDKLWKGAMK